MDTSSKNLMSRLSRMFYSYFIRHMADGQYSIPDDIPNAGFPIVGGNYMTYRAFLRSGYTYQKCPPVPGVFLKNRRATTGHIVFSNYEALCQAAQRFAWRFSRQFAWRFSWWPCDLPGVFLGGPTAACQFS